MNEPAPITITTAQQRFASWMTDVLVYIVVLNLFVEFSDAVVIDSFWISILTAVLLKALLDVITGLEHRTSAFFRELGGAWRAVGLLVTFLILFLSKFVILESVDIVFSEHVELGGFLQVVALIIALMATRRAFDEVFRRLGDVESASTLGA